GLRRGLPRGAGPDGPRALAHAVDPRPRRAPGREDRGSRLLRGDPSAERAGGRRRPLTERSAETRLDLAVSRAFGLSRRAAREAVRSGKVDVDGAPAEEPGA